MDGYKTPPKTVKPEELSREEIGIMSRELSVLLKEQRAAVKAAVRASDRAAALENASGGDT